MSSGNTSQCCIEYQYLLCVRKNASSDWSFPPDGRFWSLIPASQGLGSPEFRLVAPPHTHTHTSFSHVDLTDLGTAPPFRANHLCHFFPLPGTPEDNHHHSLYRKHSFQKVLARNLMDISKFVKTESPSPRLWLLQRNFCWGSHRFVDIAFVLGCLKMAAWSYWPQNFLCLLQNWVLSPSLKLLPSPQCLFRGEAALLWRVTQRKPEGTREHFVVALAPVCSTTQSHRPCFS